MQPCSVDGLTVVPWDCWSDDRYWSWLVRWHFRPRKRRHLRVSYDNQPQFDLGVFFIWERVRKREPIANLASEVKRGKDLRAFAFKHKIFLAHSLNHISTKMFVFYLLKTNHIHLTCIVLNSFLLLFFPGNLISYVDRSLENRKNPL